jgi:exopolysaccharide production protein ExoY
MDVCLALVAIIMLSPLLILCVVAVGLTSPGPIFFRHRRVGYQGRPFECLKFTTMVPDGEKRLDAYLSANPGALAEWKANRKLRNDPRITSFGSVLRKTSLDELPQLLNVLKGDMSIVGPRPVIDAELDKYSDRRTAYLACRPGITGLWQVSGRSSTTYRKRVACDTHYAKNWSFAMDIKIIARTLQVLLESENSY